MPRSLSQRSADGPGTSAPVQIWLAGLVGGALGCAATAALLVLADPFAYRSERVQPVERALDVEALATPTAADEAGAVVRGGFERAMPDELAVALDDARAERAQLASTVLDLSRELDRLTETIAAAESEPAIDASDDGSAPIAVGSEAIGPTPNEASGGEAGSGGRLGSTSSLDRLLAAGLDQASAVDIERRDSAWQLERLDLIDRAAREGWDDSDELDQQLDTLESARPDLREELGETAYDRYLFEGGGPNRVAIAEVIPGSAADLAGLQGGDVLMSYAGERVFRVGELQGATRDGTRGESVFVDALRDGQPVSVQLPRGPLGVSLNPLRREP